MKINISIDDRLVEKLDEYVELNYTNRSAVISTLLSQHFRAEELRSSLVTLCGAMDLAVRKGVLSDEEKQEFEALTTAMRMTQFK